MTALSRHLSSREAGLVRSLRSSLGFRHEVPWHDDGESMAADPCRDPDGAPIDPPDWLSSPRRRMNYCIRRRVKRLRMTREMRAEYAKLKGKS